MHPFSTFPSSLPPLLAICSFLITSDTTALVAKVLSSPTCTSLFKLSHFELLICRCFHSDVTALVGKGSCSGFEEFLLPMETNWPPCHTSVLLLSFAGHAIHPISPFHLALSPSLRTESTKVSPSSSGYNDAVMCVYVCPYSECPIRLVEGVSMQQ